MTTKPLVSIILPTYNRADYLSRAIDSVIDQSFTDWELITWDDGSTDETRQIVAARSDSRICYFFDQTNHGAAYARNRAIEQAKGKYLAFLDSDDVWQVEKLAQQVNALEKFPQIDFLFTDFLNHNLAQNKVYTNTQAYRHAMKFLQLTEINNDLFIINGGLLESLAAGNYIATDTVIFRNESTSRYQRFNETLRNSEDFELWWRMGLSGMNFAYLDQTLMARYKPTGSLSSPSVIAYQYQIKALDLCAGHANNHNRPDLVPCLNNAYRNAWQNLIQEYGKSGHKRKAYRAFLQANTYGFRLGSLRLLLKAMLHQG